MQNIFGAQVRHDAITPVALYDTVARTQVGTTREDDVRQTSAAAFAQNETSWTSWLRTLAGVRVDAYRFRVDAGDPRNGGTETAGLVSPKGGAVFGPWAGTELYANAGFGFHSNDARGATIAVDPSTGEPAVPNSDASSGVGSMNQPWPSAFQSMTRRPSSGTPPASSCVM